MRRYGPPEVLQWVHGPLVPVPSGEVRVQTVAAAVNRADLQIRNGNWPIERPEPFPYTPGLEVVGRVVSTGGGVDEALVGRTVITMMQRLGGIHGVRPGGYAQYVTVRADAVAVLPEDVDPLVMSALGLTAVTAWEGLQRLAPLEGARVVVLGAPGGVGSAAVSLASKAGSEVVAVVSRADQVPYVLSLGAVSAVVMERGAGLLDLLPRRSADGVLETLGARTFAASVALLRRGGRLCVVGAATGPDLDLSAWDLLQELRLTGWSSENLTGDELREDMAYLVAALRTGTLRVPSWRTFSLSEVAEAHRTMESGGLQGRLLLVPA